ncbi:GvpL/GvpF family gas vesicle protein [Streptomyces sp. NPDC048436]|uniref:GvpL/GvpF family gas vesicle protein n=1 Tax=Streptomyces sp. NPDC048436 TaxID=3365550 RepID=UPI003710E026
MSTYIYGIVGSSYPDPPDGTRGIGEPPRPVRIVRCGELAALVSDAPADLRPTEAGLLAHQDVLSDAAALGAVLPMRFGSLAPDDEAALAVLAERADHYVERLRALDGKVEYNVRASHNERAVLHQVLAENPELRAMVEVDQLSGGGSPEQKLQLGERVSATVRAREAGDAVRVLRALEPTAEAVSAGPEGAAEPEGAGRLADISFLVHRDAALGFLSAVDELRSCEPHLDLRVRGPLPPYSFVDPGPAEPAG